jgi:hypothetical protein
MWACNIWKGFLDIDRGTEEMRWWEEKLRESYKTCRETCLV